MNIFIIAMEALFWLSLFIVFYTYIGYALLLTLLVKLKKKASANVVADWPEVTIVICAYNEEYIIGDKITNTLALDYPSDKLKVMIVTDGSTDGTNEIVTKFDGVILSHSVERKGKVAAVNRVMPLITTPIVIYTDANTFLNVAAVKNIVRHYEDPAIGGVAGEKRVFADGGAVAGEGMYWKYESYLKRNDAELYSVVGAAGELFSIRTALYDFVEEDTVIEDFVLSMRICGKGYRIAYESDAYAMETASMSIAEERKRKIRITAGAFQAMKRIGNELSFGKFPLLGFQYYSHRVLRWTIAPVAMIFLFITSVVLSVVTFNVFYLIVTVLQFIFYGMGIAGWLMSAKKEVPKVLFVPYYFLFMNISIFIGWRRYRMGQQSVVWEKARRI